MNPNGLATVEDVWDDMRARWERGEDVRADDYLSAPGSTDDTERALDIVYAEYSLREEAGDELDLADYLRRFPALGPRLERQILFHNAVTAVVAEPAVVDPFPTFLPTSGTAKPTAPTLQTIAVVCSAPATLGRVADRVRGQLGPYCSARTRWYCRSVGFVGEAVTRFLLEENQLRGDESPAVIGGTVSDTRSNLAPGTPTPHEPTRTDQGFDDYVRNADLVVIFWDGKCPDTMAFLDRCRASNANHLVCFV